VTPIAGRFKPASIPFNSEQLASLLPKYYEMDFVGLTYNTIAFNKEALNQFLKWMRKGGYESVTVEMLHEYIKFMQDRHTTMMATNRWGRVKRFFLWMERLGYIERSPHHVVRNRVTENISSHVRPMTLEEYLKLKQVSEGHWLNWIYTLAWNSGMALVDCCALRWGDINMDQCYISVRRKKSKAAAVIPFSPSDELGKAIEAMAQVKHDPDDFVCPEAGGRLRDDTRTGLIRRLSLNMFRKAGLSKGVSIHSMRRSFITMLANSNMNTVMASKISGHTSPKILARYVFPDPNVLRKGVAEAKEKFGMDNFAYVEPSNVRVKGRSIAWKPNSHYIVKSGKGLKLPDGTPITFVFTSAVAEGRKAVVTPCDIEMNPVGNLQIIADITDVRPFV